MCFDPIVFKKAECLTSIYSLCYRYDLSLTISKESLKIDLACGGEISVNFDPVGNEAKAQSLIYKQLYYIKSLLRDMKENDPLSEEKLYRDYLDNAV